MDVFRLIYQLGVVNHVSFDSLFLFYLHWVSFVVHWVSFDFRDLSILLLTYSCSIYIGSR